MSSRFSVVLSLAVFVIMMTIAFPFVQGSSVGPSEPKNLELIQQGRVIILSWEEPEIHGMGSIMGYSIYRDGVHIANLYEYELSYVDEHPDLFRSYTYTVTAYNEFGEGAPSSIYYEGSSDGDVFIYILMLVFLSITIGLILWHRRQEEV